MFNNDGTSYMRKDSIIKSVAIVLCGIIGVSMFVMSFFTEIKINETPPFLTNGYIENVVWGAKYIRVTGSSGEVGYLSAEYSPIYANIIGSIIALIDGLVVIAFYFVKNKFNVNSKKTLIFNIIIGLVMIISGLLIIFTLEWFFCDYSKMVGESYSEFMSHNPYRQFSTILPYISGGLGILSGCVIATAYRLLHEKKTSRIDI